MIVSSWNVNSVRVRAVHIVDYLRDKKPNFLLLQEIKTENKNFPNNLFLKEGYQSYVYGQKSYNGVAILANDKIENIENNSINDPSLQSRVITGDISYNKKKTKLICIYVPNGNPVDTDKYVYKKKWLNIFEKYLKKIKTVGRLDVNSEGLLLLTHDGNIIRSLELPKNNFKRKYRVRVYGILNEKKLENIAKGVKIKNIQYKPFSFQILKKNKNSWIEIELFEGKKNEVRNICSILRLKVNKLIRIQFGPFKLNNLRPGQYIKADKTEYKQYENYFRKI